MKQPIKFSDVVIPTNKKLLFWNVGDKCNKAENHVCDLKKINFVIGIS